MREAQPLAGRREAAKRIHDLSEHLGWDLSPKEPAKWPAVGRNYVMAVAHALANGEKPPFNPEATQ